MCESEGQSCTSCGACEEARPAESALHRTLPIDYPDPPPAGGDHHPCWVRWGRHAEPVPAERWVHNLEHGGIVFLHHCPDGCASELAELEALVAKRPRTVLTAYAGLQTRFAAVAWGHRLLSDCLDLAAFEDFYACHYDQGPESVSSGPPEYCN
jgi:hypothetical protein